MQKHKYPPILFFVFCFLLMASLVYAGDVAVIVNKDNPIENLPFKGLVAIFKQERQYWDGKKIYLVMLEAENPHKEIILKKIYKTDDEGLKKLWLSKIFTGEIASFPKTFASEEAVRAFTAQVPNAVGFIGEELADGTIKVLKIDGKLPKEKGYVLSHED